MTVFFLKMSEDMSVKKSFAYCTCFLRRNIFLDKFALHVNFLSEEKFREDYQNVIPENEMKNCIQTVQIEIERRKSLRQNVLQRIEQSKTKFVPLQPDIFTFDCEKVIYSGDMIPKPIGKKAFSLPVFKKSFAKDLLSELKHFKSSGIPHERPNSMNKHGILLDEIGFQDFMNQFRVNFIQPWARKLFKIPDLELDSHKAFVVKYALDEDTELSSHFDNSEITLNVALSENYEGGELVFNDVNPGTGSIRSRFGFEHEYCHGVLHLGSHNHQALPITSGERWNLIFWARSSQLRQNHCPMCQNQPILEPAPLGTYGDGFIFVQNSTCNLT